MFLRRLSRDSADDRRAPMPPHGAGGGAADSRGAGMKPVDFQVAWARVHDALIRLTADPQAIIPSDEWLALYTDIVRLCTHPFPFSSGPHSTPAMQKRLYDHVVTFLRAHSEAMVQRMVVVSRTASHMDFLVLYATLFRCYTAGMERGGKILSYLDRYWILEHHQRKGRDPIDGVLFISELVPLIWRQRVMLPEISELLLRAFNHVVADLRSHTEGQLPQATRDVIKAVVESYILLGRTLEPTNPVGFYKEQLEDHVLEQVFKHYEEKSSEFAGAASNGSVDEKTVADYIRVVERCIRAEEAIWINVHSSTAKGAVRVVRKSMLESAPHHEILMAFATHCLAFRNERLADLELLYHLLDNDDLDPARGIDALRQHFLNYVKELGAREVKRVNDEARLKMASPSRPDLSLVMASPSLPANYVSSDAIQMMLDLYSHYLNIVRVTLGEDARFSKAFKSACEHFINHLPNISESLAIHTHYFLDKNCPESRTEAIDVALDSIILLFNFIHDKDLFHRCYARLLAHRIISFSSVSDEAEKRMMRHLRTVCGYQYAMTFQRMFLDKDLSEQLSGEFKRWVKERERGLPPGSPMDVVDERGTAHSHHPRRKSDSVVDFVETGDGRVTPRSTSPKLHQGMRYIGLHDASPLQMLLAKRIFADKNKRYKTSDHQNPSSSASQAGGASSAGSLAGRTTQRSQYFFGEEDWEHLSGVPSGASGVLSAAGSEAHLGGPLLVPGEEALPEVGFFAFVLTGGSWPFETTNTSLVLPPGLMRCVESFAAFYDSKHRRRRLAWLHELGHGEVVARCFDRPYTLCLSTVQMCILSMLNRPVPVAMETLMAALDIDLPDLVTALYPLVKGLLLTLTPAVTHISQVTRTHLLDVNADFTPRTRSSRLVFPRRSDETILPGGAVSPRSLDPGRMSPSILNERKSAVEARVVYLMKHSSTMRHDKLVEGVLEHTKRLGFMPPVDFVCEIIRNDIEKDFIELLEDGPNPLYRYQA